ncbi:hypothetical protein P1X14_03715 [Sphingomonas sp. AOB5]|uniref:hypothetical protein n=1 Tax=Sphingomonas sp. AOB5 TaxID=3034017 RepID=UPI0023F9B875|nr:hypothetical protein [Sphingomonas sp. AOB5]MDF7774343.1 hypothetical protein [Sphingomonas sp. AOB5]
MTDDAIQPGEPTPDTVASAEPRPERKPWFAPYRGVRFSISLKWLLAGTLIYALLLLVMIHANPREATFPIVGPSLYLTPIFGLPLVLRLMHRPGRIRRLLYFLLLLPLAHIAANYVAWYYAVSNFYQLDAQAVLIRNLTAGAWGGVTGATFAFTLLYLTGLTARRRAELATMAVATIALTVIGALGMAQGLVFTGQSADTHDREALILWFETIHLPWQIIFSLALAWLMRPPRAVKKPVSG